MGSKDDVGVVVETSSAIRGGDVAVCSGDNIAVANSEIGQGVSVDVANVGMKKQKRNKEVDQKWLGEDGRAAVVMMIKVAGLHMVFLGQFVEGKMKEANLAMKKLCEGKILLRNARETKLEKKLVDAKGAKKKLEKAKEE
ncbi:hypothetical protein E2542_SST13192 [Spatholobus suberectus]|nr:hypothetical protein E2542_SST13192 [Spatholobus suberectus]